MTTQLVLFDSRVERQFNEWIETEDGRLVEEEAVKRARQMLAAGRRRYSIDAIFQLIRWDRDIGLLGDGEFKLNDHHRSYMARRLMSRYPDLAGFFEVRELRGIA